MGLVRSKKVLKKDPVQKTDSFVFFAKENEDSDGWEYDAGYYMRMSEFEDMGSPDEITVIVEPGDTLNERTI